MQPVIIIGAARSGTNMLRDILNEVPSFGTWNCDEINPIWKHKNKSYNYDDLEIDQANNKTIEFINKQFYKIGKKTKSKFVIEKTCANSVRLDFVNKIIPNAKFLILLRNGYDASLSANYRWSSKLDLIYTLKKLYYVPLTDLPFYLFTYGKTRLKQAFQKNKKLTVWGPTFKELESFASNKSLIEISAFQWKYCVNKTLDSMEKLDNKNYHIIHYEDFVNNPIENTSRILEFLNVKIDDSELQRITKKVSNKSVGKYETMLNEKEINLIKPIIEPTLQRIKKL